MILKLFKFSLKMCISKVEINYNPQISLTAMIYIFIAVSLSCISY